MYKQCETDHSAARQRQMEQGLLEMMRQKRYEDISVSDLCEKLEVPRKSFYRYFSGKDGALYALIDHTLMDFEQFVGVPLPAEERNQLEEMEQVFRYWMLNHDLLEVLSRSGLSGILVERAIRYTQSMSAFPSFLTIDEKEQQNYTMQFAVCGLMSIMIQWHNEGFPQDPKHMARIALRLLGQPLFSQARQYFE